MPAQDNESNPFYHFDHTKMGKKQSWMEDELPTERCLHPGHELPMHLCIPAGKMYHHICPGCGKETVVHGSTYF